MMYVPTDLRNTLYSQLSGPTVVIPLPLCTIHIAVLHSCCTTASCNRYAELDIFPFLAGANGSSRACRSFARPLCARFAQALEGESSVLQIETIATTLPSAGVCVYDSMCVPAVPLAIY